MILISRLHGMLKGLGVFLAIGVVAPAALAFPGGAGTCDITPSLDTITMDRTRNESPGDYTITVNTVLYTPGQVYTVTVSGTEFTGVSLVAVDAAGNRIGGWSGDSGTTTNAFWPRECDGEAITHNQSFGDRTTTDFQWQSPAESAGRVWFEAYVLRGSRGAQNSTQQFFRIVMEDGSAPFVDPDENVSVESPMIVRHVLYDNVPNPFNPRTTIRFDLVRDTTVRLTIFDVAGRHVTTLLAGEAFIEGTHSLTWNGKADDGREVSSGVYPYRLEADGVTLIKRMTLLR